MQTFPYNVISLHDLHHKILNTKGLLLITQNINIQEGVNVSYLPDGLYFYVIESIKGVKSGVFVKW